jgi:Swiss Army Knife RNA repair-like protein
VHLLFLDFDGVLHPAASDGEGHCFCRLPLLERLLREVPSVRIVISSSWRHAYSLAQLRRLFSSDIAARVVAVTPILEDAEATRAEEIKAYLYEHPEVESFVVLDDDGCPWPRSWAVVAPDPAVGLTPADIERLRQLIAESVEV